ASFRRDLGAIAAIRSRSRQVVAAARSAVERSGVGRDAGSRREADAWLAQAAAHCDRVEGVDTAETWQRVADGWTALANPYERAKARWHQAEATLGSGEGRSARAKARPVLEQAAEIAIGLGARPLLREIHELAGRAMIRLSDDVREVLGTAEEPVVAGGGAPNGAATLVAVGPGRAGDAANATSTAAAASGPVDARGDPATARGPGIGDDLAGGSRLPAWGEGRPGGGSTTAIDTRSALARGLIGEAAVDGPDTFGLSRREREVLAVIAEGRTNREIGERLFISQKTVGVHVGNILAKLGVSGRVEAAAVAIRLGLTEPVTTGTRGGR
ncbi:MAG TPA: response regulator transcription factor, partial [Candidatus Limnocylindrales bacterium]|nr:response regulator transcription factor [Candidatus Limnocylindrales bacterium]